MPKKQDRSSAYYLKRLEDEHPQIFADLQAGKYPSANAALRAAGLIKQRTRLHELKNAWNKASKQERREFIQWIRSSGIMPSVPSHTNPVAIDQRLRPWAVARIDEIMSRRNMKLGDVMDELGFTRLDASLGNATKNKSRIKPAMISALEKWLTDNVGV